MMIEATANRIGIKELKDHDNFLAETRLRLAQTNDFIQENNEEMVRALIVVI